MPNNTFTVPSQCTFYCKDNTCSIKCPQSALDLGGAPEDTHTDAPEFTSHTPPQWQARYYGKQQYPPQPQWQLQQAPQVQQISADPINNHHDDGWHVWVVVGVIIIVVIVVVIIIAASAGRRGGWGKGCGKQWKKNCNDPCANGGQSWGGGDGTQSWSGGDGTQSWSGGDGAEMWGGDGCEKKNVKVVYVQKGKQVSPWLWFWVFVIVVLAFTPVLVVRR